MTFGELILCSFYSIVRGALQSYPDALLFWTLIESLTVVL